MRSGRRVVVAERAIAELPEGIEEIAVPSRQGEEQGRGSEKIRVEGMVPAVHDQVEVFGGRRAARDGGGDVEPL